MSATVQGRFRWTSLSLQRVDAPIAAVEVVIIVVADFSSGPWWGFNGVQALVLTENQVFLVQRGFALTSGRLRRSLFDVRHSAGRLGPSGDTAGEVHVTLKIGRRRRHYTSRYRQATSHDNSPAWWIASGVVPSQLRTGWATLDTECV
jgi:hypothetical protein